MVPLGVAGPYRQGIASILRYVATMSIWCGPSGGGSERAKVPSRVRAIEYQGNFVKVILDKIGEDELIAYVPDRVFYRDPFSVGDVVIAGWEKDKTRMLA